MTDLIIGCGEIGQAVHEVICPEAHTIDLNKRSRRIIDVNVMHICFPYSERFIENCWNYIAHYKPKHIAIWSTVPIGTTKAVNRKAIHTPVEGKHPRLAESLRHMPRWIGYNLKSSAKFFDEYFRNKITSTRLISDTRHTEALKLLSTTEYGINILFAAYKDSIAEIIKMPYELTKTWNKDYNQLYKELGLRQFQKFILDPPGDKIGGHCVVENSQLLYEQYPNELIKMLKDYNVNMGC